MHTLLFTSDPFISSLRNIPKKYAQEFSEDVKKLLKPIDSNINEEIMIDLNQSLTEINLSD